MEKINPSKILKGFELSQGSPKPTPIQTIVLVPASRTRKAW